ncbi:unnamed protein product [Didymodactylos carnosus]|uniref:G-protein coupled receptors family 1 profile domain-containing protein n=1 Tax=Didymodactylos carnosus TaxID=1234261 RepID=A0A815HC16_9BILA|nr:unnamed protein product [Didymodactylos carnosus]CAF4217086.1 unnamed protein product [Didymodactylos carnosus]
MSTIYKKMSFIQNITAENSSLPISPSSPLISISLWPLRFACPILLLLCPITNLLCIRVFQTGLLACLSIDRLLATSFVSLYRYNCSPNISFIVCILVIIIMSLVNSHYLIGYNIDSVGFCIAEPLWYRNIYYHLNVVYLLSYSIIPFSIIAVCNLFISISVCKTKTKLRQKYSKTLDSKILTCEGSSTTVSPATHVSPICDQVYISSPIYNDKDDETTYFLFFKRYLRRAPNNNNQTKSKAMTILIQEKKEFIDKITDTNNDWEYSPHLTHKQLLDRAQDGRKSTIVSIEDTSTMSATTTAMHADHGQSSPLEQASNHLPPPLSSKRHRSNSMRGSTSHFTLALNGPQSTSSAKMCMQLQITISLLAISISFIFCTLPNCISTIMIEIYKNDNHAREFWQAMNYFSLVPLLITHSVNFAFYYLSSHMFRDRFQELYTKKLWENWCSIKRRKNLKQFEIDSLRM